MASVGGQQGSAISLNIMPMLDIFSILILFLLMNFSSDPVNHEVKNGIELSESATVISLDEVPAVIINKKEILVNDKKIVDLVDGDVSAGDLSQGALKNVYEELQKLAEANRKFTGKDTDKPGSLTVEMDKTHKFKLLKRVMLSAQQADFVEFKLAVSKELE